MVEMNAGYEVFLELYKPFITFLDAVVSPNDYPQLESSDSSWNWDRETKIRAQGLEAAISVFIITIMNTEMANGQMYIKS